MKTARSMDQCMDTERLHYTSFLTLLFFSALFLAGRLVYLFVSSPQYFPVNTVKVSASYQHITRKQLELVLSNYLNDGFIVLPVARLKADMNAMDWASEVNVERIWPDKLKITLEEKAPVAVWNNALMTADGQLFNVNQQAQAMDTTLPKLVGPVSQQLDVLQMYQKLSKLLNIYGSHAASLALRDNQAWDLGLTNGVQLRLGKRDLEKRLQRFCRAYPAVFSDKPEQLSSVDLRYARGMAVQWKEPVNQ